MNEPLPVTIWMNMPSFYQSDLFRALVKTGQVALQVVYARGLPDERKALGWQEDLTGYSHRFLDPQARVQDAMRLARGQRRRLHVVNGLWAEPAFAAALGILTLLGSRYAVYSEAPEPVTGRSLPLRALKRAFGVPVVHRAAGLLPVSHLGADFFTRLGAASSAIYPFGYFRAAPQAVDNAAPQAGRAELIYVGQFVPRKGLDILLDALQPLWSQHPDLSLALVGTGSEEAALRSRVSAAGLEARIRFEGSLPAASIPARMAQAAALVLPSRWDGWGLVVNEALSVGTPVLVSDRCGVADLISPGVNGWVFRSEDPDSLRGAVQALLAQRAEWPRLRAAAQATGARISTEAIVPYVIECFRSMMGLSPTRPTPPWLAGPTPSPVRTPA